MSTERKPLLLVISQVYVPDPASVGQHMADAAEALAARGHAVRVLTSARGYENPQVKYAAREMRNGVDIVRVAWSSFGKRSLVRRLMGQLMFLLQVIVRGVFTRGLAGILVSTSPPMAGFAAVVIGFVRRVPMTYWLMDFNPDQAIALGKVSPRSPLARAMRWLNRRIYGRAAAVVVLDRFMAERVRQQYEVRGRMVVLPPWPHVNNCGLPAAAGELLADCGLEQGVEKDDVPAQPLPNPPQTRGGSRTESLFPPRVRGGSQKVDSLNPRTRGGSRTENSFAAEHGLANKFVVMYSGNHSPANPVTTLLEAALALRDDPRFVFVFVGGGLGKREVDEAIQTQRPANVVSLPYQPLERLASSLAAADLHAVTLGERMVGIIHPCKIYGAMAVGRPVLLVGPRPSHAADLIDKHDIGWQVDQGDVVGAAATLQAIMELPPSELAEMGQRARQAIDEHYRKDELSAAFCDVVERSVFGQRAVHESAVGPVALERLETVTSDAP